MAIEKGNTFHVPGDLLGGAQGRKVTVRWQQMMKSRSKDYWICKYTNKTANPSEESLIFVQTSRLDEFKNKKIDGDDSTFNVDDSFQYGQNKDGSRRFLVYNDKYNKPLQYRFIENTLTDMGGKAIEFVSQLGYANVDKVEDITRQFIDDYLKNIE